MPVLYRETVVDQPPTTGGRAIGQQQQLRQQSLLQPQLSTGSSLTGTTIMSPSESIYIYGTPDPRGTQSEDDGTASFGTWLSVSNLGATPAPTRQVPKTQSAAVPPAQQRTPSAARKEQPLLSPSQQFPLEVRVPSAGAGQFGSREAPEGGEVNRRSERWSREEFYPEKGRAPGAPFHKVTKEDYVIEQIVESTPKLVHTTRTVYPAQPQQQQPPGVQQQQPQGVQQQPPGVQQQQLPRVRQQPLGAQQQQPQGVQQQPLEAQVQQQQMPRQQYQPVQQHQQVPKQAQQNYQPQQQQQPQHYQPQQQQPQQKYQLPQTQPHQQRQQPPNVPSKPQLPQAAQQPVQPLQQQRQQNVQPVYQTPQSQNYAQQHQYVQQQVQFQQSQKQHELPQHAVQREQYVVQQQSLQQQPQPQGMQVQQQQAQIVQTVQQTEQKKVQQQLQQQKHFQPQQQQVQHIHQKEQRAEGLLQQTAKQDQAVAEEQQNQNKQHQQQHQYVHHQQLDKNAMWEHSQQQQQQQFEREDTDTVSQKKRTLAVQRPTETEQVEDDEPPPQMQLAQAPEELIQQQKPGGEGDGSFSPERQMHRKHVMVNSPWYRQHPEFQQQQQQLYQDFRNFAEPLYICSDFQDGSSYPYGDSQLQQQSPHKYYYQHFQPQQRTHQYFSPSSVKWDSVYDDEYPDGYPLPFAHGPGSPYDSLQYHQKVNLDGRRAESEQRRKHHSPVPGAAEHGYMFGGMDFMNHNAFNPYSYVSEPFDERQSRRDLHTGPPRRRGDFYGLDYTTMLPEGQPQQNEWSTEDARNYHGYQALPPRKNFRLCGHYTADPEAPLNITEANGLDEMDSAYLVGNTLSNQKCATDRELTDEEKRTFALQYGAGGFKPDHVTMRPEPVPDEPPVFSTTIGPQKSRSAVDISPTPEGYVNPMKVEGENWMLERRSERGNYGLASSGEQPPFVRPARFPPHVPQWAKQRQFTMTRGAKSVDRSLFAPSWAKVPQPQPPYWVKRSDGGGVGAVQQTMAWTQKQQNKEEQEDGGGVGAVQQTVSWTQKQQNKEEEEQDGEQWEQKKVQQDQHQEVQAVQGQQQSQQQLRQPVQRQQQIGQQTQQQLQQTQTATLKQQQQQFQPVQQSQHLTKQIPQQQIQQPQDQQQQVGAVQQKPQQQQQLYQKEKQPNQTTTTKIINQKSPSQQQQDKQAQQWQAVQQATQQKQQPFAQQVKQQQQQQTATTKSETTTTTKTLTTIANGTSKTPKTQWQQQQQQQQPKKQVRVVQQQFEQLPAQKQLFDQPGGMYYFSESRTEGEDGRAGPEGRVVQQQQVPSKDTSGLENLKVPKLGEFPSLPVNGGGKQFNGPAEQQILRNRNAMQQQLRQQHQPRPVQQQQLQQQPRPVQQQQLQQQPKFPTGRRWSQEPQEGDIFVDGHGRPVQYVREEELDPHTGETVTREEWRLVDEEEEEKGERENGNLLPAVATSAQPFFRQQITTKSTKNTSSSSSTKQ